MWRKRTCDSSYFHRTFQVAPCKSRDVSTQTVANQMDFGCWELVPFLFKGLYICTVIDTWLFYYFGPPTRTSYLQWVQQVCNVFSNGARALCCCRVVLMSQGQPISDHHIYIYQISFNGCGQSDHPALHQTIHLRGYCTLEDVSYLNCDKSLMLKN